MVAGLLAGVMAYDTYANPPIESVTTTTNEERIASESEVTAIVTGNTTLYERGQRLRNQPAYLLNASPDPTLRLRTSAPSGSVVSHRIVIEYQASRDDRAFWQERRVLSSQNATTKNGSVQSTVQMDIRQIKSRVGSVRETLGNLGTLEVEIHANVTYDTGTYDGSHGRAITLQVTENAYWFSDGLNAVDQRATRNREKRVKDPKPAVYGGLGILSLIGVLSGIGVIIVGRRTDPEALNESLYRERYAEWISEGEFPTETEKRYVKIESLEDLVDIAIDSNKRVIHDQTLDAFGVTDGDIVYYYGDKGEIDSWLDM